MAATVQQRQQIEAYFAGRSPDPLYSSDIPGDARRIALHVGDLDGLQAFDALPPSEQYRQVPELALSGHSGGSWSQVMRHAAEAVGGGPAADTLRGARLPVVSFDLPASATTSDVLRYLLGKLHTPRS